MRPCRTCPTCKRAVALQTNGTFYQHRDRWAGAPRPVCKWSGMEPPEGEDPMPEPRATRFEQLRTELAAATARAETAETTLETLREQLGEPETEWTLGDEHGPYDATNNVRHEADVRFWANEPDNTSRAWCRLVGEWREAEEGGEAT